MMIDGRKECISYNLFGLKTCGTPLSRTLKRVQRSLDHGT